MLKLYFSDLWREDTGAYRGELVEGVTKVIQLSVRGPSTSSGITVKCFNGLKGRLELVPLAANGLSAIWSPSCLCALCD